MRDKIASVKTNFVDSPLEPQVIESIRVINDYKKYNIFLGNMLYFFFTLMI